MATNRYEVVFHVGSSVYVIVEAESKEHAQELAGPIAEKAWGVYVENAYRYDGVPEEADVWMGEVDDLDYTDRLFPDTAEGNEAWAEANLPDKAAYADGWSSTFGGSR